MRKFNPGSWEQDPNNISNLEEINADSLTDLHTDKNELSVWYVGNKEESDVRNAVLGFVISHRSLDGFRIVFIDKAQIEAEGFTVDEGNAKATINEYKKLHRNITQLNARKLLKLTHIFLKQIKLNTPQIRRIAARDITLWLLEAMKDDKLKFGDLNASFKRAFAEKVMNLKRGDKGYFDNLPSDLKSEIRDCASQL